ncbi:type III-A CRISPR-associated RAMP protein Csm3 [Thermanaerothrix sp. 4228-RoL]|uniref:CRISPR system Cms endoribonuclease Csm3 n=1 Tax=Thermanaerothrix solaris TaxID=3058434 RepID=A0ABU3NP50_9CHLR|nr:type III-A CRISPR-associated RAMP protein Csm3 [Thermanaerothrix sp. 4228-RoL]MDT8898616.1 type III-A CRISPR-associated RAMP protein Csm3 [Thermanaerothrix sp. 4228-RoL]
MANNQRIQLKGRVFITFNIKAVTGLHIGGTESGIEIGGVDKTVIRDPLTNRPYIPGSSLKGKMRSLLEKYKGLRQNQRIGQGYIHSCDNPEEYPNCEVCQVFGVPGERDFATPTRLVVRDVMMTDKSAQDLEVSGRTDLPYTEVKTEVSIDRVTSAANPRQMERVPAGTEFGPAELVYSLYDGDGCDVQKDIEHLRTLVEGLQLLEDDYLGGLGSRGSGKVKLENITVALRVGETYAEEKKLLDKFENLGCLVEKLKELQDQIRQHVGK